MDSVEQGVSCKFWDVKLLTNDSSQGPRPCGSLIGDAKIGWYRNRAVKLLIVKLGNDDYPRCICSGELFLGRQVNG